MFSLNQQEREALERRMRFAAKTYRAGEYPVSFLSGLYCEFMPNAAPQQGQLMAEHVLKRIRELDETQARLLSCSPDSAQTELKQQLLQLLEEQPLQEQCRKLHALRQSLTCLETAVPQENADLEAFFQKTARSSDCFYTGKITHPARDKLLQDVVHQILSTDSADAAFEQMRNSPELAVGAELEQVMDSTTYRALYTIVLYTLLQSDVCSSLPQNRAVSIDHVLLKVCRTAGLRKIARDLDACRFRLEEANNACRALWAAVKATLVIGIIAGGTALMFLVPNPALIAAMVVAMPLSVYAILMLGDELLENALTDARRSRIREQVAREARAQTQSCRYHAAARTLEAAEELHLFAEEKTEQPDPNIR